MKPEELDEIEKRAMAATDGPWSKCGIEWEGHTSDPDPELSVVCHGDHCAIVESVEAEHRDADLTFIAHARNDVPALVAEVRRLREALGKALAYAEHDYGCMTEVGQPCSCGWAADRAAIHEALGRTNG